MDAISYPCSADISNRANQGGRAQKDDERGWRGGPAADGGTAAAPQLVGVEGAGKREHFWVLRGVSSASVGGHQDLFGGPGGHPDFF
eukprot:5664694-Prymnesium_polylepis.1